MKKYAPRKVFILENCEYIELTNEEFECRKENDSTYADRYFNGTDYISDDTEDVAETVAHLLLLDKLRSIISMLSENEQELIQALFFQGMTEREYAKECGVSQVAIHKRKNKIMAKLKIFLEN